jgi:hypothetical protein
MLVVCSILLAIKVGEIGMESRVDVEGKLLKESDTKYLVDFREGVKKYNFTGSPSDYEKVIVDKTECIKE